ncbi:hypothetical protein KHM83_07820 [Fusibacter paucivorans]|uniref:Uncharacterized protein n=1 Tax=Fusibacter paucivorans TaxID=76009 RepID=A0ABS5PN42_9FIRM|nr:hypothetical protein [Fusibacter paucivorans]MBS7526580.1 hypothetical protein [Fusibacter paucivorans]
MMTNKQLLSVLFDTMPSRLAVLGMAKNAGKTVTLNRILAWAADQTSIFGITSIGRDGEPEDVLTKTKKPAITLYPGMLFATGEQWLKNATLTYELLERTAIQTYFGVIVIGCVTQKGEIQVSGANTNAEHERVMQRLEANGANRVLVDGAMDRQSLASPPLIDGCILATGAVLSRTEKRVISLTKHRVMQLTAEKASDAVCSAYAAAPASAQVGVVNRGSETIKWLTGVTTALEAGDKIADEMTAETAAVVLKGALTARVLAQITDGNPLGRKMTYIVSDGTKLFLDYEAGLKYKAMGVRFQVIHPINLLAVTVNPVAPQGFSFEAIAFRSAMAEALAPMPVIDVCGEDLMTDDYSNEDQRL